MTTPGPPTGMLWRPRSFEDSPGDTTIANDYLRRRTPTLYSRDAESAVLDRVLESARSGRSAALVLLGEPGIGKTELLEQAAGRAAEFRVARVVGVESEMELAFAGLHQLCGPLLAGLDRLAPPQRHALARAFGLNTAGSPDRFLVGVAVLGLIAHAAEEQPLLCIVDDADRLDQASIQVLGFVARRLSAGSIAFLFGLRSPRAEVAGLPELRIDGLPGPAARALLESATAGPLDERVRDRVLAEARGNPQALLELPQALTAAELAGGLGLPAPLPPEGALERSVESRLERLPAATRLLLLAAAAEPVADGALLHRAAAQLGLGVEAAAPAEADGLFQLGSNVAFRHPLVRSVVYHSAPLSDRLAVHCALAEATDPAKDPDRRTWHRAQATLAPDDEIADELERCARRAKERGGLAAAAAFLERAVALTSDPARRAARALAGARALHDAGHSTQASELLRPAEEGPLDEPQRGLLSLLRAQIAFALRSEGNVAAPLARAAKRLESFDAGLARHTYLEALYAAVFAGSPAGNAGIMAVAEEARLAPRATTPRPTDLLLDGLVAQLTEGHEKAAPTLRRAVSDFRASDVRWHLLAFHAADDLWDDNAAHALSVRMARLARRPGRLAWLPAALRCLAYRSVCEGKLGSAAGLLDEAQPIPAATGATASEWPRALLAAWSGQEEDVAGASSGDGAFHRAAAEYARAVLNNGLGRYDDALVDAQRALLEGDLFSPWILWELVEAAVRCSDLDLAGAAVERLCMRTRASGTPLARAVESVARALVSDGEAADRLYRDGIKQLDRTRITTYAARAHLLYGEWLRRHGRRQEARAPLQASSDVLAAIGARPFAERAARELLATGMRVRRRTPETVGQLTLREAQIAQLAHEGHTNKEIGSRLFISTRTVEYHLHKVYAKLGIASRTQLYRVFGGTQPPRTRALNVVPVLALQRP